MAATVATIRRIASELAPVSPHDLDGFLDDAALELSVDFWGPLFDRVHALVAAHLASVAHPELTVPVGPITGETVGAVSRTYAAPAPMTAGRWGTSRFGVEYLRLLRTQGPGARVT